jgi:hypothetical protein
MGVSGSAARLKLGPFRAPTPPLSMASGSGRRDAVQALLPTSMPRRTDDGTAALMAARDANVSALLVRAGAKP